MKSAWTAVPTKIWRISAKGSARLILALVSAAAQMPIARRTASTTTTTAPSVVLATSSVQMDASTARTRSAAVMEATVEPGELFIWLILSQQATSYSSRPTNSAICLSHSISLSRVIDLFRAQFMTSYLESGSNSFSVLNAAGYAIWKDEVYSFGGYVQYGESQTRILKLLPGACEFERQSVTLRRDFGATYESVA